MDEEIIAITALIPATGWHVFYYDDTEPDGVFHRPLVAWAAVIMGVRDPHTGLIPDKRPGVVGQALHNGLFIEDPAGQPDFLGYRHLPLSAFEETELAEMVKDHKNLAVQRPPN